jgi:hypothetical protein
MITWALAHSILWRHFLNAFVNFEQKEVLSIFCLFFVGEAYTHQGREHSRRIHPDWAARPALMRRAAHAVESKAVVRIEVAVSPRPCLGCAVELVLRVSNCLLLRDCLGAARPRCIVAPGVLLERLAFPRRPRRGR